MSVVTILGAGTWGTALAHCLAGAGHEIRIWSALRQEIRDLQQTRRNPHLPDMILPEEILQLFALRQIASDDVILTPKLLK
jgi:glycerol-3-phosphate dehydrogenase (NAD(P)+)